MKTLFKKEKTDLRHEVENILDSAHAEIMPMAYQSGKSKGMKEPPLPLVKGDKLIHHIGDIKAQYEQVGLKVLNLILPQAQHIQGRTRKEYAEMHNERIMDKIKEARKQIRSLEDELKHYDPSHIASRIRKTNLACTGLFVGEVILSTEAFQVTGDNLLFSLGLSASVSLAVCLGAHFAGRQYQDATNRVQRWIVVGCSAAFITILSSVVASLRGVFFQKTGVDVNPDSLAFFNVVFFGVAALATWYWHPTKKEIDQNRENLQKYYRLQEFKAKEKQLEEEQLNHEQKTQDNLLENVNAVLAAEYAVEIVHKQYKESIGKFWEGNLFFRSDIPECIGDPVPELDIPHIAFKEIIKKYKSDENNENHKNNSGHLAA